MEDIKKEKPIIIDVYGAKWSRNLINTHFITIDDNFEDIVKKYVLPVAQKNDVIILCQKIVSIMQKRIIYKKDIKVGFWAKTLSKFVKKTPHGFSVGNPLKMQVAIDLAGLPRIFLAGACSIVCKLFGISGVFYRVAGHQISEIDGFYGEAYSEYADMGILGPKDCDALCDKLHNEFGFHFAVADINDLGGNILGISKEFKGREKMLLQVLKDNPAGQSTQQTPVIILRRENAN